MSTFSVRRINIVLILLFVIQPVDCFFAGLLGPPSSLNPPFEVLSGTSIDPSKPNVDLKCVYKASRDGWSATDFHEACDGRGSGLVVVLTTSGKKFGGFNPLGWQSSDDYGNTNSAFLWFEKNGKIFRSLVLPGGNAAVFDFGTGGPQFGASELIIGKPKSAVMGGFAGPDMEDTTINAGSLKTGYALFGGAYQVVDGYPVGAHRFVDVEVYCNANIIPSKAKGGLWPF